jgi:hypothetical protein
MSKWPQKRKFFKNFTLIEVLLEVYLSKALRAVKNLRIHQTQSESESETLSVRELSVSWLVSFYFKEISGCTVQYLLSVGRCIAIVYEANIKISNTRNLPECHSISDGSVTKLRMPVQTQIKLKMDWINIWIQ